jgi:hypothetical protein
LNGAVHGVVGLRKKEDVEVETLPEQLAISLMGDMAFRPSKGPESDVSKTVPLAGWGKRSSRPSSEVIFVFPVRWKAGGGHLSPDNEVRFVKPVLATWMEFSPMQEGALGSHVCFTFTSPGRDASAGQKVAVGGIVLFALQFAHSAINRDPT